MSGVFEGGRVVQIVRLVLDTSSSSTTAAVLLHDSSLNASEFPNFRISEFVRVCVCAGSAITVFWFHGKAAVPLLGIVLVVHHARREDHRAGAGERYDVTALPRLIGCYWSPV